MSYTIRLENESDYRAVENLTREAFWDIYRPGCFEHLIMNKIRKTPAFVKELCFVACDEKGAIVGNIVYSRARVVNDGGVENEVLCLGPVSVLPSYQKKGIGSMLIRHSIEKARGMGFKSIMLFGSPGYYPRFGFVNAKKYGITTSSGENIDPFMALELYPGALTGINGMYFEDKVFEVDAREVDEFDKSFPAREKHKTATQIFQ